MSNILILGDVHIGKSLAIGKAGIGSILNSRIADQINLLDWVLEQAIEYHVNKIVITGDIFEEPKPQPLLITLFMSWINRCVAHDVSVDIIMGNHDILRSGTYYNSPLDVIAESNIENCSVYKDINTIIIDSTAFTYLPFRDRKSFIIDSNSDAINILSNMLMYEVSSIPLPYTKVLIGHLAIEGSIPIGDEIDDITNELFCPINIFEGYDYVWMGHVHKPQIMRKSPLVAHIGSMDISNFGETDHKKHIVLFDTEKLNYSQIEIPTRSLVKINISIPKDTENTTQYVLDEIVNKKLDLNKAIVKLELALASSELKSVNRGEIEKFIYKNGAFNIAGFSESKKLSVVKKTDNTTDTKIDSTLDVSAAIKMWANKKWPTDADLLKRQKFTETAISILNDYKAGVKS